MAMTSVFVLKAVVIIFELFANGQVIRDGIFGCAGDEMQDSRTAFGVTQEAGDQVLRLPLRLQ